MGTTALVLSRIQFAVIFVLAFGTLAISLWSYMTPFVLTINEAAAPPSLAFMFCEGIFVFPLMLLSIFVSYTVFRDKVPPTSHIH